MRTGLALLLCLALALPLLAPAGADEPTTVTLRLGCHRDPQQVTAMEWSLSRGTCWMHGGHHTFHLDGSYTLLGGVGNVFSVEQQLSPPTAFTDPPFDTPVVVQVSGDGRTWTDIGFATYQFLNLPGDGAVLSMRQSIDFELAPHDVPFRFVRVHQPPSAAQGLSGFLDTSRLDLDLQPAPTTPGTPTPGQHARSCTHRDILEAFFATHPCTFGGINRYDAASFTHTYPLGAGAMVHDLTGTAALLPWRSDDWFVPLVNVNQTLTTTLYVETSPDGFAWTRVATVSGVRWGVPAAFQVSFDTPVDATFVRLHGDWHPRFDETQSAPSLHHLESFLTTSAIQFNGTIPQ